MNKLLSRFGWLRRIIFSFSLQLLMVHLKKNLNMVLFWLFLFGLITGNIAPRYGIPYLFLSPEYFDKVSFGAYFLTGFGCGGFIMAFHISSYILNCYRFPFVATLANPFIRYCINNSIIPLVFVGTYMYAIYQFLLGEHLYQINQIIYLESGFAAGVIAFILFCTSYFFTINKDIYRMFGVKEDDPNNKPLRTYHSKHSWKNPNLVTESRDWYVETYLIYPFINRLVRPIRHYKKDMLIRVFRQNNRNAFMFIMLAMLSLFSLSYLQDIPLFNIPAASSLFLLFTMLLMLSSAMYTWIRGWSLLFIIGVCVVINFAYKSDLFNHNNKAYGLNYETAKAEYKNAKIDQLGTDSTNYQADVRHTIEILNKWRLKNSTTNCTKPPMVLINAPGGGLRASLWTFYSLQYIDSLLNGQLLKHTELITGSSGGMVGAAYLRELYLRQQHGTFNELHTSSYANNMGKDILNPIAFSLVVNDFFFPLQKVAKGHFTYNKDRAFAFEWKLNQNTNGILDKTLHEYQAPENDATIPLMVFSPTIANDGRKLLVASQPISYLCQNTYQSNLKLNPIYDALEFNRLFEKQGANNLRFTTALRMSASFPFVSPLISLPSEPRMELLDAGLRDNFGLELSLKFMHTFRNWITTNTSGVIIIQIRDKFKESPVDDNPQRDMIGNALMPLGILYDNLFMIQDLNQNQLLQYASLWFDQKVEIIDLVMNRNSTKNVSLSWHLTNKEKNQILKSIDLPANQQAVERLKYLLLNNSSPNLNSIGKSQPKQRILP